MFDILKARIKQGYRTMPFPKGPSPILPLNFKGCPEVNCCECEDKKCMEPCPVSAISECHNNSRSKVKIDLGKCIFCARCAGACKHGSIRFSNNYRLSGSVRESLHIGGANHRPLTKPLDPKRLRLFGKSLRLRQVSAGGCNACEADTNVLTTIAWDLQRFGIDFVASPRHADGILVTGPVTKNMAYALKSTYEAVARPKVVIALGTCAISGGLFEGHDETLDGISGLMPVDLYIPGCPPHPLTILDGLLRLTGKIDGADY
ncbi:MAG: NADH-quinone oxidoreductase subunit NuoB [Oligoflexales bacterium]|nr:NADH-quinone oxidoreductase subunit NuoB [Oligoflexales bacterium]